MYIFIYGYMYIKIDHLAVIITVIISVVVSPTAFNTQGRVMFLLRRAS